MDNITREERLELASKSYGQFLTDMGFDWEKDPNMCDTPKIYANRMASQCIE